MQRSTPSPGESHAAQQHVQKKTRTMVSIKYDIQLLYSIVIVVYYKLALIVIVLSIISITYNSIVLTRVIAGIGRQRNTSSQTIREADQH